jgi:hypothetical protein
MLQGVGINHSRQPHETPTGQWAAEIQPTQVHGKKIVHHKLTN